MRLPPLQSSVIGTIHSQGQDSWHTHTHTHTHTHKHTHTHILKVSSATSAYAGTEISDRETGLVTCVQYWCGLSLSYDYTY